MSHRRLKFRTQFSGFTIDYISMRAKYTRRCLTRICLSLYRFRNRKHTWVCVCVCVELKWLMFQMSICTVLFIQTIAKYAYIYILSVVCVCVWSFVYINCGSFFLVRIHFLFMKCVHKMNAVPTIHLFTNFNSHFCGIIAYNFRTLWPYHVDMAN